MVQGVVFVFLFLCCLQVRDCVGNTTQNNSRNFYSNSMQSISRILTAINNTIECDGSVADNLLFRRYFNGVFSMYRNDNSQPLDYIQNTCIPKHHRCGWATIEPKLKKKLPVYVLSVGLEG